MILSKKVRLYPSEIQEKKLWQSVGTARFIYNWTLARQEENYKNGEKFISDGVLRKESGELFYGFNHMAEQLQKMIDQLSEERAHRNEIKFRLLQMQIKPHFLYNLFNNMIWMMEQKDYEKLEVLIQSTAEIGRASCRERV